MPRLENQPRRKSCYRKWSRRPSRAAVTSQCRILTAIPPSLIPIWRIRPSWMPRKREQNFEVASFVLPRASMVFCRGWNEQPHRQTRRRRPKLLPARITTMLPSRPGRDVYREGQYGHSAAYRSEPRPCWNGWRRSASTDRVGSDRPSKRTTRSLRPGPTARTSMHSHRWRRPYTTGWAADRRHIWTFGPMTGPSEP